MTTISQYLRIFIFSFWIWLLMNAQLMLMYIEPPFCDHSLLLSHDFFAKHLFHCSLRKKISCGFSVFSFFWSYQVIWYFCSWERFSRETHILSSWQFDNVSFQISGCILLYSSFILFSKMKMKSTDHLIILLLWVDHFSL